MDLIATIIGNITGAWKKVAAFLPLVAGAGSVLAGAGGILLELSHSANAGGALAILKGLQADPNTALIVTGLTALGLHQNHLGNVAAIQATQPQAQANPLPPSTPS